ncbi:MAG: T9SS type A sorting domain-containing protein [Flavobacteriales bacterium]|nr:T9SS type A sorting domain-containing protein [Flavobacteriales bacterium]
MPSPVVTAGGTIHVAYPSYVATQNIFAQFILATSTDAGNTFTYQSIIASTNTFTDSLAKKAYLLRSDPIDDNHLIFLYIAADHGDGDVFMLETFNGGGSWSNGIRVNDDPIGNDRMQDMVWADFDSDGDLIVTWRDRRNGSNSTYMTDTEMWGAIRWKDSTNFSANFMLSDQSVAHDTILEESGNDFMCVKLVNDTLNAVWGDTRSGKLNIWFERIGPTGMVTSRQNLSLELKNGVEVYPNPGSSRFIVEGSNMQKIVVYNQQGKLVASYEYLRDPGQCSIDLSGAANGTYLLHITTTNGLVCKTVVKQ